MKDKKLFLNYMTLFGDIHSKKISEITVDFYWKALEPYDDDKCKIAFDRCAVEIKWFPKPAEIIERISGSQTASIEDVSTKEALKVIQAVREIGYYRSVIFDDPITIAVVKQGFGGWMKLCEEMIEDKTKWFIKDFKMIYKSYQSCNIKDTGKLPGFFEQDNFNRGYLDHIPKPIMITDGILTGVEQIGYDEDKDFDEQLADLPQIQGPEDANGRD